MARVRSLGPRHPVGLNVLTAEGFLSPDYSDNDYIWQVADGAAGVEEELVAAKHCVIWSQGGIIRRIFRFSTSNQPITHALFADFENDPESPEESKPSALARGTDATHGTDPVQRALVAVAGSQMRIYFMHGSSNALTLPFELDAVFAASRGVILQRKPSVNENVAPTPVLPSAPPNSFLSSQFTAWPSSFLNNPRQDPGHPHDGRASTSAPAFPSILGGLSTVPSQPVPRLFTLIKPASELGLVTEAIDLPASLSAFESLDSLDESEEVISVSPAKPRRPHSDGIPLTIVVTSNRSLQRYTVWTAVYGTQIRHFMPQDPLRKRKQSFRRSTRRSSYNTRLSTGATTPTLRHHELLNDSFPARNVQAQPGVPHLPAGKVSESFMLEDPADNWASQPQPDIADVAGRARPMRSSRRTSSMMARAELSSQDQNLFTELARNPPAQSSSFAASGRARQSFGPSNDRTSFGRFRLSGRASTPGSVSLLSDVDEAPSGDDGFDDLTTSFLQGRNSLPLTHPMGPKKELVLVRAFSVPFGDSTRPNSLPSPSDEPRVVLQTSLTEPQTGAAPESVDLFLLYATSQSVFQVSMTTKSMQRYDERTEPRLSSKHLSGKIVVLNRGYQIHKLPGIFYEILNVSDGGIDRVWGLASRNGRIEADLLGTGPLLSSDDTPPAVKLSLPIETAQALESAPVLRAVHTCSQGSFTLSCGSQRYEKFQLRLRSRNPHVLKSLAILDASLVGDDGPKLEYFWMHVLNRQQLLPSTADLDALILAIFCTVFRFLADSDKMAAKSAKPFLASPNVPSRPAEHITEASKSDWNDQDLKLPALEQMPLNTMTPLERDWNFVGACFESAQATAAVTARQNYTPSHESAESSEHAWTVFQRFLVALHLLWIEEQRTYAPNSTQNVVGLCLARIALSVGMLDWPKYVPALGSMVESLQATAPLQGYGLSLHLKSFMESLMASLDHVCEGLASPMQQGTFDDIEEKLTMLYESTATTNVSKLKTLDATLALARLYRRPHHLQKGHLNHATRNETVHSWELLPEPLSSMSQEWKQERRERPSVRPEPLDLKELGREDLSLLLDDSMTPADFEHTSTSSRNREPLTMEAICNLDDNLTGSFSVRHHDTASLLRHIFRDDKRWYEAAKLVDPLRVAVTTIHPDEGMTEAAFLDALKDRAQLIYQRTMALPSGQAIMRFSTTKPALTEKIKISTFNTTCSMQPSNNSVNADKSNFTEEKVGWAFFHAGVNAGLQASKEAAGIDTSWLVLNKPSDLGNRHAGLLLALGLNGHLKKMAKWLAFKYLTAKHTMTSVGLLLGLAASSIGSMDSLITRLLSVHVSRLLPPGAAELNLSPLTQTAGVMSVGLLYYDSQHRRMSEVMLSEIEHVDLEEHFGGAQEAFRDEGYRLAAAFSLGLINLGKGKDLRALHDLRVVERLLAVATGPREINTVHVLDQATAGATVAIALIFLKTHDKAIAKEIDIPSTTHQYDTVRPDILLLRTVARWLIMWDDIVPSIAWVKRNSPKEWSYVHEPEHLDHLVLDSSTIPFYNIVAGLCWAIALRFAGTSSPAALRVLHHYFGIVSSILAVRGYSNTFDRSLTRDTLLRWQHVLALSMATVCAGTGDLEVLRVLRGMHGDVTNKTFGFHQATHMAIGLLFVNEGRSTLGTNNLAIAAMLMAFYPVFPKDILDNRAHLQALRHFWVFAVEARCLIPRDVETHEPLVVPIEIVLQVPRKEGNENSVLAREAPCLLPELETVRQVCVAAPGYWPVTLDFENNAQHLKAFKRHQTVFLKRRPLLLQQPHVFGSTLIERAEHEASTLADGSGNPNKCIADWISSLAAFKKLSVDAVTSDMLPQASRADDRAVGREASSDTRVRGLLDMRTSAVDDLLVLAADAESDSETKLMGLKWLLDSDALWQQSGHDGDSHDGRTQRKWLRAEWIAALKAKIVARAERAAAAAEGGVQLHESRDAMDFER